MTDFPDRRVIGSFEGRLLIVDYACKPNTLYIFADEIVGPTATFLREWSEHRPEALREVLTEHDAKVAQ